MTASPQPVELTPEALARLAEGKGTPAEASAALLRMKNEYDTREAKEAAAEAPLRDTAIEAGVAARDAGHAIDGLRDAGLPDKAISEVFEGKTFPDAEVANAHRVVARIAQDPQLRHRLLSGDRDVLLAFTDANGVIAAGTGDKTT
jgi:hypothetical protein